MGKLRGRLGKEFVLTSEVAPPRGPGLRGFEHELKKLKEFRDKLSGVNVVDIPGSRLLMSSLGASILLLRYDIEPIYQLTCRDRNILALQADLLAATAFGVENILALTGDHPACLSSDHPFAKPVFDLDSTQLIKLVELLNSGRDAGGSGLNQPTNFFVGAAIAPAARPLIGEILKTKRKLEAGARFFQTQVVFEAGVVGDFLNAYEKEVKEDISKRVLMGLIVPHSLSLLEFLGSMPGVSVPQRLKRELKAAKDPREVATSVVLELVDAAKAYGFGGAHVMPAGDLEALSLVLEQL